MTTQNQFNEGQIAGALGRVYEPLDSAEFEVWEYGDDTVVIQAVFTITREEFDEALAEHEEAQARG